MGAPTVEIITDGACEPNPGPGGWAAIVRQDGRETEVTGFEANTTNNRMEMMAAIAALQTLKVSSVVTVTTDSQYLKKGAESWMAKWQRNGWKTAKGDPVKNADLWQILNGLLCKHSVRWIWVRGHAGHADNERVDALAQRVIEKNRRNAA